MTLKEIDPKLVVNFVALAVAFGVISGIVWWAVAAFSQVQDYRDPTQEVIREDGLL